MYTEHDSLTLRHKITLDYFKCNKNKINQLIFGFYLVRYLKDFSQLMLLHSNKHNQGNHLKTIKKQVYWCYVGRKCQYQPLWSNTDLQVTNITIEWIVLQGSCDHEYLKYKVFRQKSEVFDSALDSVSTISVLYISEEIVSDWITRENYFKSIIVCYLKDPTNTLTSHGWRYKNWLVSLASRP